MKRKKLPISKKHLKETADQFWKLACIKAWGQNCEVCLAPGVDIHHFYPRNCYGILRLVIENGVILCRGCHFKHHFKADPAIHQAVIEKRGKVWDNKLKKQSQEEFISGQTIGYYKETIEELKNYLEKKNPDYSGHKP